MLELITGVKIPTTLSDCLHSDCKDCGYKESARVEHTCKDCINDLKYLNKKCADECVCDTIEYDHHLCEHRTKFMEMEKWN